MTLSRIGGSKACDSMLLHPEIPIGGSLKKVRLNLFVSEYVSEFVQAFLDLESKWVDRSGRKWDRLIRLRRGKLLVLASVRSVLRGTCYSASKFR